MEACRVAEEPDKTKDDHIKSINYRLPTRIGNWENELAIEEANMAVIQYKKAHNQLLSSRTRLMLRNVLEPVELSPCVGGVEYDKIYQIFSPSSPSNANEIYPYENKGLYLAGVLNEYDLDKGLNFMHGCLITAAPDKIPCRRNTFIIRSPTSRSNNVYYGDDIFIEINSSSAQPLYLQAEGSTMDTFGAQLVLRLSQAPDNYCYFRILHAHPRLRKDSLGMTIMSKTNVIIQHLASGRNLAAEIRKWITTFFGVECFATCQNYKNSNRIETAENMWQIVGHQEMDDVTKI